MRILKRIRRCPYAIVRLVKLIQAIPRSMLPRSQPKTVPPVVVDLEKGVSEEEALEVHFQSEFGTV